MVRTALMRVRSGDYQAAQYLASSSFSIVPVSLAGAVPSCCSLVS